MGYFFISQLVLSLMAEAAEVLIMPSSLFPVHRFTMRVLAEELIKRKHNLTWVEYGFQKSHISLPEEVHEVFWQIKSPNQEINDLYLHHNHSLYSQMWDPNFNDDAHQTTAWMTSIDLCAEVLSKHKLEFDAIVAKKFSVVILDDLYNPCGLLLVGLQKSTYIYWSMSALRTESAWASQSPSPPSYLPVPGTRLTDHLNFLQRLCNFVSYFRALYIHQHLILRRIDKLFKKYYSNMLAEVFYIERNASLNFINTPQIFDFARPYMPRVIFVGGIQCHKAFPLKGDLFSFVDGADERNGFIVLSAGFGKHWKFASRRIIDSFVQAFAELSKVRFVWQYNGPKITNLPANVFVAEWLPLQDLLGHFKVRAHITHGGLNSVIESVWHGVPVIGIPLTTNGYDNLLRLTSRGAGLLLMKQDLTKENIKNAIKEIYNSKFRKAILTFQDMVTDVPYTELNHSTFWVEFIERHNEVPQARSGADELNFLQYFLLDVALFVFSIIFSTLFLIYIALKFVVILSYRAYKNRFINTQKSKEE